jgi:hypothetical protein
MDERRAVRPFRARGYGPQLKEKSCVSATFAHRMANTRRTAPISSYPRAYQIKDGKNWHRMRGFTPRQYRE